MLSFLGESPNAKGKQDNNNLSFFVPAIKCDESLLINKNEPIKI